MSIEINIFRLYSATLLHVNCLVSLLELPFFEKTDVCIFCLRFHRVNAQKSNFFLRLKSSVRMAVQFFRIFDTSAAVLPTQCPILQKITKQIKIFPPEGTQCRNFLYKINVFPLYENKILTIIFQQHMINIFSFFFIRVDTVSLRICRQQGKQRVQQRHFLFIFRTIVHQPDARRDIYIDTTLAASVPVDLLRPGQIQNQPFFLLRKDISAFFPVDLFCRNTLRQFDKQVSIG